MPALPHINLVAKLNRAREQPDYDVFAADQRDAGVGHEAQAHTGWIEKDRRGIVAGSAGDVATSALAAPRDSCQASYARLPEGRA
jgi:hypothetical protein